jgi:ubiquinone/menaquinone biosynthesis C-methylase UbiE
MADPASEPGPNAAQARYWASRSGMKWIAYQQKLDRLFSGVTAALLEAAAPRAGQRVLDFGCGTGETALALAEKVGPSGEVVAIDISAPLLDQARQRAGAAGAANIRFVEADAQSFIFAPASADLLVSRFGAMFFSDPVAAFRNIRTALRPGAEVHLAAWGPVDENPWFIIPRDAAIARLGPAPKGPPNEPGPLAFADRVYVQGILRQAGFAAADAAVVHVQLIAPDTLMEAGELAANVGPSARIVHANNGTADDEAAIAAATSAGLTAYRTSDGIRVPAVINLFSARCP